MAVGQVASQLSSSSSWWTSSNRSARSSDGRQILDRKRLLRGGLPASLVNTSPRRPSAVSVAMLLEELLDHMRQPTLSQASPRLGAEVPLALSDFAEAPSRFGYSSSVDAARRAALETCRERGLCPNCGATVSKGWGSGSLQAGLFCSFDCFAAFSGPELQERARRQGGKRDR